MAAPRVAGTTSKERFIDISASLAQLAQNRTLAGSAGRIAPWRPQAYAALSAQLRLDDDADAQLGTFATRRARRVRGGATEQNHPALVRVYAITPWSLALPSPTTTFDRCMRGFDSSISLSHSCTLRKFPNRHILG